MENTAHYAASRQPLAPAAFLELPLGAVEPRGWLLGQLKLQSWAITGHLDEIWPDVGPNSGWLGGTGEDWERGPYYMDGFLPMAFLLNDPKLIDYAKSWVNYTLEHQDEDGWLGPQRNRDW